MAVRAKTSSKDKEKQHDPKNGLSCHQCRKRTMSLMVSCKRLKKAKTCCTLKFCRSCLLNRYGLNAEEVNKLVDWNCPKCSDYCNCSVCMKRRGRQPMGHLIQGIKQTGLVSVHAT